MAFLGRLGVSPPAETRDFANLLVRFPRIIYHIIYNRALSVSVSFFMLRLCVCTKDNVALEGTVLYRVMCQILFPYLAMHRTKVNP